MQGLYRKVELPINFDIVKAGFSIVYNEESQVIISKIDFLSLKIVFVLANSVNSGEMSVLWHFIGSLPFAKVPVLQKFNLLGIRNPKPSIWLNESTKCMLV